MSTTDFEKGAKAMFDALISRTCHNYHHVPGISKRCEEENKLITEWASDALKEVSPDDYAEWVKITELQEEIQALHKKLDQKKPDTKDKPVVFPIVIGVITLIALIWFLNNVDHLSKYIKIPVLPIPYTIPR